MSVLCDVVGLEALNFEIKRAGGRLSSPSSRPPAVERVRLPEEGGWGEENTVCFGLRSRVQVTVFGHRQKHFLQAFFQLILEFEGIQTGVEIA